MMGGVSKMNITIGVRMDTTIGGVSKMNVTTGSLVVDMVGDVSKMNISIGSRLGPSGTFWGLSGAVWRETVCLWVFKN